MDTEVKPESHLNSPTFFFFGLEDARSAGSDGSGGTCRGQREADKKEGFFHEASVF